MALDYQVFYILGSGLLLQERNLDVRTNNLANVNTPGFKKDFLVASSWFTPDGVKKNTTNPEEPSNNYVYPIVEDVYTIFEQGNLVKTGNPTDVAIQGNGFFAVQDGEGNVIFTRKGMFRLNEEGYLTTEEGYLVLDENFNPIQLLGSEVKITKRGYIYADGELVGRLGVWDLENPVKIGRDFFSGNPIPTEDYEIYQGFYEASNVNAVKEIVQIIKSVRAHEFYTKLVQAADEVQGKLNNLL